LFEPGVRRRAERYVGTGAIVIERSTPEALTARVRGGELYRVGFERVGEVLRYACSCPFFRDRGERCKHLCALAFQASQSELVQGALQCRFFVADESILPRSADEDEATSPDDTETEREESERAIHTFGEGDDEQGSDDFDDEHPEFGGMLPSELGHFGAGAQPTRSAAWRELARQVARRHAHPQPKLELLYFLSLGRRPQGGTVTIGQRRLGANAGSFGAAGRVEPEMLERAEDRELFGLLMGHRALATSYQHGDGYAVAPLSPFIAPTLLQKLAATGRCHVVPDGVTDIEHEWHTFASGRILSERAQQKLGLDFARLLAWPLLEQDAGAEYRLELALSVSRHYRSSSERLFDIEATLLRAAERHDARGVGYVHPATGSLVLGHRLTRCTPAEAAWLATLTARGGLGQVTEAELPELLDAAYGPRGVSAFKLPADYELVVRADPLRPMLSLEAPRARKLRAKLWFEYGAERVSAERSSLLVVSGKRAWERDREGEQAALQLLEQLGFTGKPLKGERSRRDDASIGIEEGQLPAAIRALLTAGWLVEAEGRSYRSATRFDVAVESGIDWFEVRGGVKFGGAELPFPRLLRAIKKRRPFVELGDGSFGVLPEEWMQRWGLLAELTSDKSESLRISSQQIGLMQALLQALPEQVAGARGLKELRHRLDDFEEIHEVLAPTGFCGELRPYQALGLSWLFSLGRLGFGACLADDMGLGKTIQVLALLLREKVQAKSERKPALVVVPRTLLTNWLEEAKRFVPGLVFVQHWGADRGRNKLSFRESDVVLTTYGTLRLDIALLSDFEFGSVVLDEAQAIKNRASATARCAKLLRAERRIALSGTPVENHLGELWSLFEFLNPGLLRELSGLRKLLESGRPSEQSIELVRTLVKPFVLRRTKAEVAKDLPSRVEQTIYVELGKDERQAYDELLRHYQAIVSKKVKQLGTERATPHMLEALLRLRQAACHPGLIDPQRHNDRSAKVELLVDQLKSLREEGHRALVFSQFTSLLGIVRERLTEEGLTFEYLDGKTRDRAARVVRFQSDPSIQAFLISLKAGGVGLNLTGADYVVILDPWWNPAAEAQAIDRAHRIGQVRNVIAYRLLAKNTVEERVAALQAKKRDLVASIMGDAKALSSRLTREDLEALLSLTEAPPNQRSGYFTS